MFLVLQSNIIDREKSPAHVLNCSSHFYATVFTRSFGWEGSEVFQQQDVQELTRVLFDALEESFKGTEVENIIDDLYAGELIDYLRCIDVDYQSERVDKFLDFALTIIPFGTTEALHSLSECIETYLRPEILDGENKYYAESVGRKVDAIKGLKFGKLPQIMSVQLKRFVYDFSGNSMVQKKLNDRVTFPMLLDMNTYVTRKNANNNDSHFSGLNGDGNRNNLEDTLLADEGNLDLDEGEFEKFLKEQIAILRKQQKSRADDNDDNFDSGCDNDRKGWSGSGEKTENKNDGCNLYASKTEVGDMNMNPTETGSTCTSTTTNSSNSKINSADDVLPSLYPSLSIPFIPIALTSPISTAMAAVNPVATATAIPVATAMAISTPFTSHSMSSAVLSSFEVVRGSACAFRGAEDDNDELLKKGIENGSVEDEENEIGETSPIVAVASAYLRPLFSKSDSDDDVEIHPDVSSTVTTCAMTSQQNPSAFFYAAKSGADSASKIDADLGMNSDNVGEKTTKIEVDCQNMPSASKINELLETRGEWIYELYAVLNHSGAISGGHYYAYIKDMESKKWYNFNDSNVTEISEEKVSESWGGKSAYEGLNT